MNHQVVNQLINHQPTTTGFSRVIVGPSDCTTPCEGHHAPLAGTCLASGTCTTCEQAVREHVGSVIVNAEE